MDAGDARGRMPQAHRGLSWLLLVLLALLAVGRSALGTRLDSFTVDEPWHIVAGTAYVRGGDPVLDKAVAFHPQMEQFLVQTMHESQDYPSSRAMLESLVETIG